MDDKEILDLVRRRLTLAIEQATACPGAGIANTLAALSLAGGPLGHEKDNPLWRGYDSDGT